VSDFKKKPLVLGVVFVVLCGAGVLIWKKNQKPKITYREEKVERGVLSLSILSTGTVQPQNRLEIKPPIAGRVEKVLVKEGQLVQEGQILAWMSSTERAALIDAARSQGPEELKRWETLYRPTPVMAPISGTIILRNVESGQTFTNVDPILVMSDRLTVKAQVDETDIAQIKLKQPAEIVLDAYSHQKISARVDQIAFEAKTVNNVTTYLVDVLPISAPGFMRSGMTANVTFHLESRKNTLLIPSTSLRAEKGAATVLIRDGSGKMKSKEIQVGLSDGKKTEVVSGLSEGESVFSVLNQGKEPKRSTGSSPFSPMGRPPRGK
jgi:membrane fusion protein, macrolide-specific efflux system